MPIKGNNSHGEEAQTKVRRVLCAILDYADGEINDSRKSNPMVCRWYDDGKLTVNDARVNTMLHRINAESALTLVNTEDVKRAFGDLEALQILTDQRGGKTQGVALWRFDLKFQAKERQAVLTEFDRLWVGKWPSDPKSKFTPKVGRKSDSETALESSPYRESSTQSSQTASSDAQEALVNGLPKILNTDSDPNHLPRHREEPSKKTILMLSATPDRTQTARWKEELQKIRGAIDRASNNGGFELEDRQYINSSDVSEEMRKLRPYIVHISGCADGLENLLCSDSSLAIRDGELKEFIAELFRLYAKEIFCIVLSGCHSEEQSRKIVQDIEFVIGISAHLEEVEAVKFINEFYYQLASGQQVVASYRHGRNCLQRQGYSDEARLPRLFIRSDEIIRRDLEKQLELCVEETEREPANITLWKKKASLLKDLGRTNETDEAYEKVASLDPKNYENRVLQGDMLESLGDHGKANTAYDKALKLEEEDYKIWWKKAIAQANAGEYEEAAQSYKKALALIARIPRLVASPETNSDKYILCREYGSTLVKLKKTHNGIQAYRTTLWLEPNYRLASYEKKRVYRKIYAQKKQ
jgi:Effector-associated domain 4/Tetratricopeptide repeat